MVILVGSTRPAKVEGTREALAAMVAADSRFADPIVRTVDLTHIAPLMPLSTGAILEGARRRAHELLAMAAAEQNGVLAIGLEGGVGSIEIDGSPHWTLQTWAAVTDGNCWGYGAGGTLMLPDAVMDRVLAGEELGDVIDGLSGAPVRGTRGAWGVLTLDLVGRKDAFRLAVLAACAPFYNRRAYAGRGPNSRI